MSKIGHIGARRCARKARLRRRDTLPDRAARSDEYLDVHYQVFRPDSFLSVMSQIAEMVLAPFRLRSLFRTHLGTSEFRIHRVSAELRLSNG